MKHTPAPKHKKRMQWRGRSFLLSILLILILMTGMVSPVNAENPQQDIPTVDPVLLAESKRSASLEYLVFFEEQADLSAAYEMDWEARGWYVYETLTAFAEESQARVQKYLESTGISYTSFWAENAILVESSTSVTLNGLLNFTEIDALQSIPQVMLVEPEVVSTATERVEIQAATSNLTHINADDVWTLGYAGEGMVVGSIDTGVRYTHQGLVNQYRGNQGGGNFDHNYNWWDAVNGNPAAYDDHWHGTHTTGIMVGDDGAANQIGVAPGAEWIACKALDSGGTGTGSDLLECGQFMLAPTNLSGFNANPSMRPNVVNNSWGDCVQSYFNWFESTINAWLAAGIYPVFANGNAINCQYSSPPGLNTVGNPARSYNVTAVGSTGTNNGQYATHSTWGPTDSLDTINPNGFPSIKPQVVAPGVSIRSAVVSGGSNSTYGTATGTSMSAPHVAGLVALMWQAAPCLMGKYAATETLLQNTAVPIPYATGNGDEGPGNVPNHATGWGEIDALAAVEAARDTCARLIGVVKNISPEGPIVNAKVTVKALNDRNNDRSGFTDLNGYYEIFVSSGEWYTITAFKFGYTPFTITNVMVSSDGETITNNFFLTEIDMFEIFLPLVFR